MIEKGVSLDDIAEKFSTDAGAIAYKVQKAIETGVSFDFSNLFGKKALKEVMAVLTSMPEAPLRVIREKISTNIDYPVLRIAAAYARYKIKNNQK
jgi:hypothetical protein